MDNGVIDVTSGSFALDGNLTGSGAVDIGSGASVTLTGVDAASADTVAFNGTNDILTLNSGALNAPAAFTASGFNPSDVIDVQGTVTGASYNNGVLTLTDGTTTVNQLTLAGNFSGDVFAATPLNNGYSQISVSSGGDTATAPVGTGQRDSFVWGSTIAGSWDSAANWNNTIKQQSPAAAAPGSTDFVTINQAAGGVTNVITGVGDSASLTIGGATVLQGQFTTNALFLEEWSSSFIALPSSSSLTVDGPVTGNDGASIAVTGGQFTVGGDINNRYDDSLTVSGGAAAITGNITNNFYYDTLNVSGGTAAITGGITNTGWYDNLYVSGGGTLTVGGTVATNIPPFIMAEARSLEDCLSLEVTLTLTGCPCSRSAQPEALQPAR